MTERFEDLVGKPEHDHCWHAFRGPLMMVVPNGHIVQKCCKCPKTRTVHAEHAHD